MRRNPRYAVAVLVAVGVTGGVAAVTPRPERAVILLLGIAVVYAVGTAIALRYPDAIWGSGGNWASGVLAGVTTFAGLSLLQGVEGGQNLAVAALGWGLVAFGFVAGVAFEREENERTSESSSDPGRVGSD